MMGYYNNNGYGWGGWMLAIMLIWPLLLAGAIWAVIAITRDRPARQKVPESPVEILNQRFARGEISEREYIDARALMNNESSREAHRSTT